MKKAYIFATVAWMALPVLGQPLNEMLGGRGVWLQKPKAFQLTKIPDLEAIGVKRVHVMGIHAVAASKSCKARELKPTATTQVLEGLGNALRAGAFAPILTLYATPDKTSIDALTDVQTGLVAKLLDSGFQAVEYDLEGGWSDSVPCGFSTHLEAASYLFTKTRALKANLPVGVTTHLGRARDPNIGLDQADWLSIQVYTKCASPCVSFVDKREGPGFRQSRTAQLVNFAGPVIVGLAAYNQKWPDHSEDEAMSKALDATYELQKSHPNFVGHSYWSTSWLVDGSPQQRFLKRTATKKVN